MNGVGGSVIHWGGALRRCHPHHFAYLTHVRERFGEKALPKNHTLADWPVSYEDLEPYYAAVEYLVGVAGDADANPFVPRSEPYPLPPLRPSRTSEVFRGAAEAMEVIAHGGAKSSRVIGKKIEDIDLLSGKTAGVMIGAIVRGEGEGATVLMAHHDTVVEAEDHVIVFVANKKMLSKVEKLFQVGLGFF